MADTHATPSSATTHAALMLKQAVQHAEEGSCLLYLLADRICPVLDKDHAGDAGALRAAVRAMGDAVDELLRAHRLTTEAATAKA